jgi:hypothetical protein
MHERPDNANWFFPLFSGLFQSKMRLEAHAPA